MDDTKNLVIDESNFSQYFFDARKCKPKQGQILAKFTAVAQFIEGQGKRDIINLLKQDKAYQAVQVMKRIHGAKDPDGYRICREICQDFLVMELEDVEKKVYEYTVEYLFYTQREYVPNNQHWETIQVIEYDPETKTYKSRIEI
jgi:hypothetical protein